MRLIKITVVVLVAASLAEVIAWLAVPTIPSLPSPENLLQEASDETPEDVLKRFREDRLTHDAFAEGTTYRLILYPTFDSPVLVQARLDAAGPYLKTKTLTGQGGYELGQLNASEERPMTPEEWNRLKELVDDSRFWHLPTDAGDDPVADGAFWSFSGREFGNFHGIHRITPKEKTLDLFLYLLRLSDREQNYKGYWY